MALQQGGTHHQQQADGCSFLFIQPASLPKTCTTGFAHCQEPAVWCWPQDCSQGSSDFASCSVNGTAHYCICSSVPPAFETEPEDPSTHFITSPAKSINTSVHTTTSTATTTTGTTMSSWYPSSYPSSSSFYPIDHVNQSSSSVNQTDGLSTGVIIAIVVVSVLVAIALIALSVWSVMKLKRKRKLEGKYCPAVEEQKSSASTLPPLPLPAPEGLI